jgi:hypothetical protein
MNEPLNKVEALYLEKLRNLSPEERVLMAGRMFSAAKTLATAGILSEHPDISELELKKKLVRRFYGRDFTPEQLEKIDEQLERMERKNENPDF